MRLLKLGSSIAADEFGSFNIPDSLDRSPCGPPSPPPFCTAPHPSSLTPSPHTPPYIDCRLVNQKLSFTACAYSHLRHLCLIMQHRGVCSRGTRLLKFSCTLILLLSRRFCKESKAQESTAEFGWSLERNIVEPMSQDWACLIVEAVEEVQGVGGGAIVCGAVYVDVERALQLHDLLDLLAAQGRQLLRQHRVHRPSSMACHKEPGSALTPPP